MSNIPTAEVIHGHKGVIVDGIKVDLLRCQLYAHRFTRDRFVMIGDGLYLLKAINVEMYSVVSYTTIYDPHFHYSLRELQEFVNVDFSHKIAYNV